jgi:hypothetical protein
MHRRELLKAGAVILGFGISPSCQRALESNVDLSAPPVSGSLSESQLRAISILAELIIPETDTPGAVAAGVPAFIHQIVVDWYTEAERRIFLQGLADLDAEAERHWSRDFLSLDSARQAQLLAELEPPMEDLSESRLIAVRLMPPGASGDVPFFFKLKELTVLGYYTSEKGASSELIYRPVPGAYDGDALFDDSGRQWSI